MEPLNVEYPQMNPNTMTLNSQDAAVYKQKGDALYQAFKNPKQSENQLLDAINEYTRAAELSDDPEILAQMAKAYLLNGQFDQTEKYLDKLMNLPEMSTDILQAVLETQAMLHFHYGQLEHTKALLEQAVQYGNLSEKANHYLSMAVIQIHLNQYRFSPKGIFDVVKHAGLGLGASLFSRSFHKAIPYAKSFGVFWLNRLRSEELALDALINLYQEYPGLELLPIEIGKRFAQKELYIEAEFWFNRALDRHPTRDDGYRKLVTLYQVTGNTEMLIKTLERWLLVRPNNGEIMSVLSQSLANLPEEIDRALEMAKKSLIFLTDHNQLANAYINLGNLYCNVQQYDAAVTAYQASLNANPYNLDTYIQLGTLYYDKQEFALSQRVFEKALALAPDSAKILCNLGYLAWMQGNIQESLGYYHRSITSDPTYDIALNNLGVLYMDHIGNMEMAMSLFEQTLYYNPNYALCYYNKGRAFSFLGRNIEAARCFSIAQELNHRSNELDNGELTERIKQLFESNMES